MSSSSVGSVKEFMAAVVPALEKNFPNMWTYVDTKKELTLTKFYQASVPVVVNDHEFYGSREVSLQCYRDELVHVWIQDEAMHPSGSPHFNWTAKFLVLILTDGKFKLAPETTLNVRFTKGGGQAYYDAPDEKRQCYQGQFAGTLEAMIELLNKDSLATQPYFVCKA